VASLMLSPYPIGNFIISFVIAVITAWLFGYAFAWLYNRLAR